jgi:hypothetical protein
MKELIQACLLVALLKYLGFHNPFTLVFVGSPVSLAWFLRYARDKRERN